MRVMIFRYFKWFIVILVNYIVGGWNRVINNIILIIIITKKYWHILMSHIIHIPIIPNHNVYFDHILISLVYFCYSIIATITIIHYLNIITLNLISFTHIHIIICPFFPTLLSHYPYFLLLTIILNNTMITINIWIFNFNTSYKL
jgi:hypothetical protein